MIEQWKPVPDWEGHYEVSNCGRVRTIGTGHIKSLIPDHDGYLTVFLHDSDGSHYYAVHRLVLTAFVGPCPPGHETHHIDGHKTNNHLLNLQWVTRVQNCRLIGGGPGTIKLTEADVLAMRALYDLGKCTTKELAEQFNMSYGATRYVVLRKSWKDV